MGNRKVIFFDCMETLIDMHELPGDEEYALWALEGSGAEQYWNSKIEFIDQFRFMRQVFKERTPLHREYDIYERFRLVVQHRLGEVQNEAEEIVQKLVSNYWRNYRKRCYVSNEVTDALSFLAERYKMGVVSNFIVKDGIEELLHILGIQRFFKFLVTSVDEGWRKPHPAIYQSALLKAETEANHALFIGDDFLNDYIAPRQLGFTALFYDKKVAHTQINHRFTHFSELKDLVVKIF